MNRPKKLWKELIVFSLIALASCLTLLSLAACSTKPQSDQEIKQHLDTLPARHRETDPAVQPVAPRAHRK